jgi:hypothetical protein
MRNTILAGLTLGLLAAPVACAAGPSGGFDPASARAGAAPAHATLVPERPLFGVGADAPRAAPVRVAALATPRAATAREFEPAYSGASAATLAATRQGNGPVGVRIWMDGNRDLLYPNERVRVRVRTDYEGYVAVFHLDTNGDLDVLYPRSQNDDGWVDRGRTLVLSSRDGWDYLRVRGGPGIGYVFAVALDEPLELWRLRDLYRPRGTSWDASRSIWGDPFYAMDEIVRAIVPEWASGYESVDYYTYHVGRRYTHPRYACYDGYGDWYYSRATYWPSCDRVRIILVRRPYYYDTWRWRGSRRVYYERYYSPVVRVRERLPLHGYKERTDSYAPPVRTVERRPQPAGTATGNAASGRAGRPEANDASRPGSGGASSRPGGAGSAPGGRDAAGARVRPPASGDARGTPADQGRGERPAEAQPRARPADAGTPRPAGDQPRARPAAPGGERPAQQPRVRPSGEGDRRPLERVERAPAAEQPRSRPAAPGVTAPERSAPVARPAPQQRESPPASSSRPPAAREAPQQRESAPASSSRPPAAREAPQQRESAPASSAPRQSAPREAAPRSRPANSGSGDAPPPRRRPEESSKTGAQAKADAGAAPAALALHQQEDRPVERNRERPRFQRRPAEAPRAVQQPRRGAPPAREAAPRDARPQQDTGSSRSRPSDPGTASPRPPEG